MERTIIIFSFLCLLWFILDIIVLNANRRIEKRIDKKLNIMVSYYTESDKQ